MNGKCCSTVEYNNVRALEKKSNILIEEMIQHTMEQSEQVVVMFHVRNSIDRLKFLENIKID